MDNIVRGVSINTRAKGDKMVFVASDDTKDRHGTIINIDAWDLKNFKNNPIMSYQHQTSGGFFSDANPDNIIGTWDISIEGKELIVSPNFEPADINPLAEKIRKKVKHGTLRAVSVGFIPRAGHWGVKKEMEDVDTFYYDNVELLEVSIVNVPSNPNALKRNIEVVDEFIKSHPKPNNNDFEFIEEKGMSIIKARARILSLQIY